MRAETNYLIGDSRPSHLYKRQFIDRVEAQSIADAVCDGFYAERVVVVFSGRPNHRQYGTYKAYKNGKLPDVVLSCRGENWGTLAHELGHHIGGGPHGWLFKDWHRRILIVMEDVSVA